MVTIKKIVMSLVFLVVGSNSFAKEHHRFFLPSQEQEPCKEEGVCTTPSESDTCSTHEFCEESACDEACAASIEVGVCSTPAECPKQLKDDYKFFFPSDEQAPCNGQSLCDTVCGIPVGLCCPNDECPIQLIDEQDHKILLQKICDVCKKLIEHDVRMCGKVEGLHCDHIKMVINQVSIFDKLGEVGETVDSIEAKVCTIDSKIDVIDNELGECCVTVNSKLDVIDNELGECCVTVNSKLDIIDNELGECCITVNSKLDVIDN